MVLPEIESGFKDVVRSPLTIYNIFLLFDSNWNTVLFYKYRGCPILSFFGDGIIRLCNNMFFDNSNILYILIFLEKMP